MTVAQITNASQAAATVRNLVSMEMRVFNLQDMVEGTIVEMLLTLVGKCAH